MLTEKMGLDNGIVHSSFNCDGFWGQIIHKHVPFLYNRISFIGYNSYYVIYPIMKYIQYAIQVTKSPI